MAQPLDWDQAEDIAIALVDKFPDTDPLTVRFTDLHKWVKRISIRRSCASGYSGFISPIHSPRMGSVTFFLPSITTSKGAVQ